MSLISNANNIQKFKTLVSFPPYYLSCNIVKGQDELGKLGANNLLTYGGLQSLNNI
jgi:hypothetical protein